MAEFISFDGKDQQEKQSGVIRNMLKDFWHYIASLDKFTKMFFISALLFIVVTPVIVSSLLQTKQHAANDQPSLYFTLHGSTTPVTNPTFTKGETVTLDLYLDGKTANITGFDIATILTDNNTLKPAQPGVTDGPDAHKFSVSLINNWGNYRWRYTKVNAKTDTIVTGPLYLATIPFTALSDGAGTFDFATETAVTSAASAVPLSVAKYPLGYTVVEQTQAPTVTPTPDTTVYDGFIDFTPKSGPPGTLVTLTGDSINLVDHIEREPGLVNGFILNLCKLNQIKLNNMQIWGCSMQSGYAQEYLGESNPPTMQGVVTNHVTFYISDNASSGKIILTNYAGKHFISRENFNVTNDFGTAAIFNGTTSYMDMYQGFGRSLLADARYDFSKPQLIGLLKDFTVELWVKWDGGVNGDFGSPIFGNPFYGAKINPDHTVSFYYDTLHTSGSGNLGVENVTTTAAIEPNKWHHVAIEYKNNLANNIAMDNVLNKHIDAQGMLSIYIDGTRSAYNLVSATVDTTVGSVDSGQNHNSAERFVVGTTLHPVNGQYIDPTIHHPNEKYFGGKIDELRTSKSAIYTQQSFSIPSYIGVSSTLKQLTPTLDTGVIFHFNAFYKICCVRGLPDRTPYDFHYPVAEKENQDAGFYLSQEKILYNYPGDILQNIEIGNND